MANFWDDYTGGSLMETLGGLATTALPSLLDKPGATGTTAQSAPAVPPAPLGSAIAPVSAAGWFEQNKMMVIGGGVVVVLVLVLVMGRK